MITKEITIAGKQITLAYCYATEIAYKILSEQEITDFMAEASEAIQAEKMPDIRKSMFVILAAVQAYYEANGEEIPITDKELMYESSPEDIGLALGTIIGLRMKFYHTPAGEPEDKDPKKKSGKKSKNA
jgi:hypothetical protein